jgi:hypothetical protein
MEGSQLVMHSPDTTTTLCVGTSIHAPYSYPGARSRAGFVGGGCVAS